MDFGIVREDVEKYTSTMKKQAHVQDNAWRGMLCTCTRIAKKKRRTNEKNKRVLHNELATGGASAVQRCRKAEIAMYRSPQQAAQSRSLFLVDDDLTEQVTCKLAA